MEGVGAPPGEVGCGRVGDERLCSWREAEVEEVVEKARWKRGRRRDARGGERGEIRARM